MFQEGKIFVSSMVEDNVFYSTRPVDVGMILNWNGIELQMTKDFVDRGVKCREYTSTEVPTIVRVYYDATRPAPTQRSLGQSLL